jgi:hypothetical protein
MKSYLILGLALCGSIFAAQEVKAETQIEAKTSKIRLMPVKRTPEAEASSVIISLPTFGHVVKSQPVWLQIRVDGYPIGASSPFDRQKEIAVSNQGQTMHVVVDNQPYFAVSEPAIDPFNEAGWYYETNYKFEIPTNLETGEHLVRVFLSRTYGECLKGDLTFFASTFYVGEKGSSKFDLKKPFLTYNEPSNQLYLVEGTPILLDFFISNCELTTDGYKVRLTIDKQATRILTDWQPYYIYGLEEGQHTVRLELLGPDGSVVKGPFNDVEQTITVHQSK